MADTQVGFARAMAEASNQQLATSTDEELSCCVVCMDKPITHIMIPCGHHCVCEGCSGKLMANRQLCPICQGACAMSVRVFSAM